MKFTWREGDRTRVVELSPDGNGRYKVDADGVELEVTAESLGPGRLRMRHADGSVLASSSFDGTVKLWDMSDGRELLTLTSQPHSLGGVDFSPDGRTLATAGADGMIRFFIMSAESIDELMATARSGLSRDLTHEECARYLHTPICKEA